MQMTGKNIKFNLKIANMVFVGKIMLSRMLNNADITNLVKKGKLDWSALEECGMSLHARIVKEGMTVKHRNKTACIRLFPSGSVNIMGVTSAKEARKHFAEVVADIKNLGNKLMEVKE